MASVVKALLKNSKSVLMVCDVQERFKSLIYKFDSVAHVSNKMVSASKSLNLPVFVTEQYPKALGKTIPEIDLKGITPTPFEKMQFSMLTPELLKQLEQTGRKQVMLVGIEAHVCVLQTAIQLLERGYDVHIVADGVSSQRKYDREFAFDRLRSSGATLTTSESAIFQLLESASNPKFKEVQQLFKQQSPDPGLD